MLTLDVVVDLSGWTIFVVMAPRVVFTLAITQALAYTTVVTLRMLVSFVEVMERNNGIF